MKVANREIGSEFWSVELSEKENSLFPDSSSWYLSGRSALKAIISDIKREKNVSSVAMPSWCCDSMITPFLDVEIEVSFYPVYIKDGKLIQKIENAEKSDALFVMDYFGYTQRHSFDFHGPVIRDVTHSLFSAQYSDADYYFGSLRKWSGFFTGGYAWGIKKAGSFKVDSDYVSLRKEAMRQKSLYISGASDSKDYLSVFSEAEEYLEKCDIGGADIEDEKKAKIFDVEYVRQKRRENAKILMREISDIALFDSLNEEDCPMFVPIFMSNEKRDSLRSYLIRNGIYCPIHWPISKYHSLNSVTSNIYERELSLVCDQRYGSEDMYRMVDVIKSFLKG